MKRKERFLMNNRIDNSVTTQLRLGEGLYEYVRGKADELGISMNAVICIMLDLGRRAYEGNITLSERE